ncbi:transposase [Psychromonas arctica]|uniref:transposase n=1 Tax=Psychromonas arctica TaxID=168275 RepID=UPI003CC984B3
MFSFSEGQVHDIAHDEELINQSPKSSYIVADKGYNSEKLREHIHEKGVISVILRRKNNKIGNNDIDWYLYKYRHLVENTFGRIKNFPAIATGYNKLEKIM